VMLQAGVTRPVTTILQNDKMILKLY